MEVIFMSKGTQLIVCRVVDCTYNEGKRCSLPQIEVGCCDRDVRTHQTKCLSFKRSEDIQ